jgi:hypothetical protein
MARISQTEFYRQTFAFENQVGNQKENLKQQNVDRVMKGLLGDDNWQNLKDNYGTMSMMKALEKGDIYLEGLINITLYVDPTDHESFLLEGFGRYYLIREIIDREAEILLSGDFHIELEEYNLADLSEGYLDINVKLFVTRIPLQFTYFFESPLKYKVRIDNRMGKYGIFAIDYTELHEVYLNKKGHKPILFGKMEIKKSKSRQKLIDLRGIKFLRNDYKKLFRKTRR